MVKFIIHEHLLLIGSSIVCSVIFLSFNDRFFCILLSKFFKMTFHLFSTLLSFKCILCVLPKTIPSHQEMIIIYLLFHWLYIKHIIFWGCRIHIQRWTFLLLQIHLRPLRLQLILRRCIDYIFLNSSLRNHCLMIRMAVTLTRRCGAGRAVGARDLARKAWRVWNQLNWLADWYIWETWLVAMLT